MPIMFFFELCLQIGLIFQVIKVSNSKSPIISVFVVANAQSCPNQKYVSPFFFLLFFSSVVKVRKTRSKITIYPFLHISLTNLKRKFRDSQKNYNYNKKVPMDVT